MERLVDYDKFIKDYGVLSNHEDDYRLLCAANITAYTKDEVIAMLTELQLELDEMKITKVRSAGFAPYSKDPFRRGVNCSKELIQQKIDELKEQKSE